MSYHASYYTVVLDVSILYTTIFVAALGNIKQHRVSTLSSPLQTRILNIYADWRISIYCLAQTRRYHYSIHTKQFRTCACGVCCTSPVTTTADKRTDLPLTECLQSTTCNPAHLSSFMHHAINLSGWIISLYPAPVKMVGQGMHCGTFKRLNIGTQQIVYLDKISPKIFLLQDCFRKSFEAVHVYIEKPS